MRPNNTPVADPPAVRSGPIVAVGYIADARVLASLDGGGRSRVTCASCCGSWPHCWQD